MLIKEFNLRAGTYAGAAFAISFVLIGCASTPESSNAKIEKFTTAESFAQKCLEINSKVEQLKALNSSRIELNQINSLQRELFVTAIRRLYESGNLSEENWILFENYLNYDFADEIDGSSKTGDSSKVVKAPENPNGLLNHLDDGLKLEKLFDSLISKKLISPYLYKEVIKRGDALAIKMPEEDKLILSEPECFPESTVSLVRSISKLRTPEKSNWGSIKTGSELLKFLE